MNLRSSLPLQMAIGAVAFVLFGFLALVVGQTAFVIALIALTVLLGVYRRDREKGIILALAYLVLLGDIRRVFGMLLGFPTNDPLILVGTVFVLIITLPIFFRLRLPDLVTKFAVALLIMQFLQIFNPAQGGLLVGFSGALIEIPPVLWFFVGRFMGSERMLRTLMHRFLLPMAVFACLIGLYQTFIGVPFWQQAWVDRVSVVYNALHLGGSGVRAFGFSTASSEYLNMITLANVFCVVAAIAGRRIFMLPLVFLLPMLFLGSSRGSILHLLLAGAIGFTFKSTNTRTLPVRFAFALAVGVGGLAFGLAQHGDYVAPTHGGSNVDYALAHQINGLNHPLDKKYSTAGLHSAEIVKGMVESFRNPIGYGIGSANIATSKFGHTEGGKDIGSEFDLSDSFISLGLFGGLIYLGFIVSMIRVAYQYTKTGPKDLSLAIFAMQFALLGDWLFPGEYGNGPFFFILLGCVVNVMNQPAAAPAALPRPTFKRRSAFPVLQQPLTIPANLKAMESE